MKFHIFSSKESPRELRKHTVDGRLYTAAIETLSAQGYEINDVWVEDEGHTTMNTQRSYHHENQQSTRCHTRKGGYYR